MENKSISQNREILQIETTQGHFLPKICTIFKNSECKIYMFLYKHVTYIVLTFVTVSKFLNFKVRVFILDTCYELTFVTDSHFPTKCAAMLDLSDSI